VDLGVFNLLRATVFHPDAVEAGPILAKAASTVVAIAVNWVGNRYWTFGADRTARRGREALEFLAVSLVGMAIGLGCLYVSHYLLGLTSPLADNVSANVIGLGLGSAVRFVLYRQWVYSPARRHAVAATDLDVRPSGPSVVTDPRAQDAAEPERVAAP